MRHGEHRYADGELRTKQGARAWCSVSAGRGVGSGRARVAADAAPDQRLDQLDGALLGDRVRRGEPPACADLGDAGQPAGQQLGVVALQAGVARDRVGDRLDRQLQ